MFKRDLNNAIDSELIKLSGSEFQQSMRRQENENKRALTLESGLFNLKRCPLVLVTLLRLKKSLKSISTKLFKILIITNK